MANHIKTTTGVHRSKKLAKQVVHWGKKGADVSTARSPEEMLYQARLDWAIDLQPIVTRGGTQTPWRQAVRVNPDGSEIPLSIVPDSNWDALSNMDFCGRALKVADSFGGSVSRAGWVQKETKAVAQASFLWAMINPGENVADLAIDQYEGITPIILLTSGTSYGCGYSCRMLFVRDVCQNGIINMQSTGVRSTHQTDGAFQNFTLEEVRTAVREYTRDRDLLVNTPITNPAAYAWFIHQFGTEAKIDQTLENQPKKVRQLWDIYNGDADLIFAEAGIDLAQAKLRGTYYGVLQSLVAFNNHFGDTPTDNKMVDIMVSDRGKQMDDIRRSLAAAALVRQQNTVSVGVRAW